MPVLMTHLLAGADAAGYAQLAGALGPKMEAAPGFVSHVAAVAPDGIQILEVWESEAAHAAWYDGEVKPLIPAGAPAGPAPVYRPVAGMIGG